MIKQLLPLCFLAVAWSNAGEVAEQPEDVVELQARCRKLAVKVNALRSDVMARRERAMEDLKYAEARLVNFRDSEHNLGRLKVTDAKAIQAKNGQWCVEFKVTNQTDTLLTRLEFDVRLMTPGHKLPWEKDALIVWELPGGLNPGETRACVLWPGNEQKTTVDSRGDQLFGVLKRCASQLHRQSDYQVDILFRAAFDEDHDVFSRDEKTLDAMALWELPSEGDRFLCREEIAEARATIDALSALLAQLPPPQNDSEGAKAPK